MNVLDFIFIAILLIFTFRGLARGLINEVFGFGSFALALLLGVVFYQKMADIFMPSMNPLLAKILGFLTVFICVFILMKIIQPIMIRETMIAIDKDAFFFRDSKQLGQGLGPSFGLCGRRGDCRADFVRYGGIKSQAQFRRVEKGKRCHQFN